MNHISLLEEYYKKFSSNLNFWLPEGVLEVNLDLLSELDLLSFQGSSFANEQLTSYFHVIETEDKITLINQDFVVWIVPDLIEGMPTTYILIGLNKQMKQNPKLELAFYTRGVYNTSKLVLRVLEKLLKDIQETEELMMKVAVDEFP